MNSLLTLKQMNRLVNLITPKLVKVLFNPIGSEAKKKLKQLIDSIIQDKTNKEDLNV